MLQIAIPKFSYANGTILIGRFGRAPIYAHVGFCVIAALLVLPYVWLGRAGLALFGVFVVFASVLIHELAHAEVGRRYGAIAQRIDLNYLGGLVTFWSAPMNRRKQAAITLAGPLSNLAIALICYIAMRLVAEPVSQTMSVNGEVLWNHRAVPGFAESALRLSAYFNAAMFVVNMLPAYPLDGGKLAWMAIARATGEVRATLIVGALGTVLGIGSALVFVMSMLAGWPIWSPPSVSVNWQALQAARQGYSVES